MLKEMIEYKWLDVGKGRIADRCHQVGGERYDLMYKWKVSLAKRRCEDRAYGQRFQQVDEYSVGDFFKLS